MSLFRDSSAYSLSELVDELRRAYWLFRGRKPPDEIHPKWYELANLLQLHAVIPGRYIRWAYKQFRPTMKVVWIKKITSPNVVEMYLQQEQDYVKTERLRLDLQLSILRHELGKMRSVTEILDDDLLDLDDAVRYAVARKAGLSDRAEQLKHWADLDLTNEPVYEHVLSAFLG